jgi:hypothetical protein
MITLMLPCGSMTTFSFGVIIWLDNDIDVLTLLDMAFKAPSKTRQGG